MMVIDKQVLLRVAHWMIENERKPVRTIRQLAETEENYLIIMREIDRVEAQLLRARSLRAEATLTLIEWFAALDYFHWHCAYCQEKPFQVMSHIEPLPQRGATRQNCIPACYHCRGSKHKEYAHIREYTASMRTQPGCTENGIYVHAMEDSSV
jgi:5-methylcytosine-specific restriction endonuclease McrA